jgi:hypothetical protein
MIKLIFFFFFFFGLSLFIKNMNGLLSFLMKIANMSLLAITVEVTEKGCKSGRNKKPLKRRRNNQDVAHLEVAVRSPPIPPIV